MEDMLTTEYDGCGRCLVGVRRLSRKTDKTSSPEKQGNQILSVTGDNGGHIIAWADDWEVSGATDPLTRPGFGPWLRGEMGPYDGVVSASVDRVGRNVRDTLNTQALLTGQDRIVITADHTGVWDFSDPNEENNWIAKAWGSQMELRAIQKRNRDETIRARNAGEPKQRPSYSLWDKGNYRHAVADAATNISNFTQNRLGRHDISDRELMAQAFSDKPPEYGKPRLRCPGKRSSETSKSLQQGAALFAMGTFQAIRNPAHHSTGDGEPIAAFEDLVALSKVARWVTEWHVDQYHEPIDFDQFPVTSESVVRKTTSTA
jgi:uncharacterized protein (TIGR02391 family)